jgi:hypothetical protein
LTLTEQALDLDQRITRFRRETGVAKTLDILAKEMLTTMGIVRRQHDC